MSLQKFASPTNNSYSRHHDSKVQVCNNLQRLIGSKINKFFLKLGNRQNMYTEMRALKASKTHRITFILYFLSFNIFLTIKYPQTLAAGAYFVYHLENYN